jgi:phosphate transport system permease protein
LFRFKADRWLTAITGTCAIISAAVLLLVILFLVAEAWPALRTINVARFVTDDGWYPLSGQFNLLPMVAGTLLTSAGAILLAAPLGVSAAVFGQFYAGPAVSGWYRRLVELAAGIPSVVYGVWGLVVLVPVLAPLGGSGQSLLAATLILALMILPMIVLTAGSALAMVSADLIQGGAALGLGRWSIASRIAVPAAGKGIVTGILLAVARALGETIAVVMVAGNVVQLPGTVIDPVRTLTANMALEMEYATSDHRAVLFVSGVMLMAVVGLAAVFAELLERRSG